MLNSNLPSSARVMIYPAEQPIEQSKQQDILNSFQSFLEKWHYHGTELQTDIFVLNNQFVILAINDEVIPGGCSLDVLSRNITKVEQSIGLSLNNRHNVYILRGENVISIPFNKADSFELQSGDKIINLLCKNLQELKDNFLQEPQNSTYSRLFSSSAN